MFYFIILAIIGFILFKMRNRIMGGIVVSIIFIGMIFFSIFMLDWYVGVDVRQYVNIGWYDKTIQNPVKVGEELAGVVKDEAINANTKLEQVGSDLDTKFGVTQDDKGVWQGVKDGTDEEGSSSESEVKDTNFIKALFSKESEQEPDMGILSGEEWVITYSELDDVLAKGGFTKQDIELLKTLSPHNPGNFTGEQIKVSTTKELITIIKL